MYYKSEYYLYGDTTGLVYGSKAAYPWEWINEGGDCLGQTCWLVEDVYMPGYCLQAELYTTSFNLEENSCDASNPYQLFTNPPTVAEPGTDKWGKWYNEGVSQWNGADSAVILNANNHYLYVEDPAITDSYNQNYVNAQMPPD